MTYQLAKKLKDEGLKRISEWTYCDPIDEVIPLPTLSELIEACGENILKIEFLHDINLVTVYGYGDLEGKGLDIEEAVANLWLKLNRKDLN